MLKAAVDDSFNCISVEGHMSTNDTVLALANGASGVEDDLATLAAMIREACISLARMIPDDGEGATHLITIDVEGARTPRGRPGDRPGRRRQPPGEDRHPRRRPELGADRLRRRLRGRRVRGGRPLALAQRDPLYRDGVPLPFDDADRLGQPPGQPRDPHPPGPRPRRPPPSGSGPATSPPSTSGSTPTTRPESLRGLSTIASRIAQLAGVPANGRTAPARGRRIASEEFEDVAQPGAEACPRSRSRAEVHHDRAGSRGARSGAWSDQSTNGTTGPSDDHQLRSAPSS